MPLTVVITLTTSSIIPAIISSSSHQLDTSSQQINDENDDLYHLIKPLNLEGGQCIWCGKYGHKRRTCPYLK